MIPREEIRSLERVKQISEVFSNFETIIEVKSVLP